MAYLVTGGTGSMGSYVVRDLLKQGKEVVCLQRSGITPFLRNIIGEDKLNGVKIIQADISNTLRLFNIINENQIGTIVHLSSQILSTGLTESQPDYALQVNCVGMNNVLEAGRLFGLRRIIWTSSFQSVGEVGKYYKEPISDDAIYKPDSMYGATKALNEFMAKLYNEKFGVDVIGFRIGAIVNVHKSMGRGGVFTQFLKDAATDKPAAMAAVDINHLRPLGYVENVSDLLTRACDFRSTATRTFNVVEYMVSCRQIVESIRRVNPRAKVTLIDGVSTSEATWGGAQEPMIESKKICQELGWAPKYSLDEAITRIFNHFREQEGLPQLQLTN